MVTARLCRWVCAVEACRRGCLCIAAACRQDVHLANVAHAPCSGLVRPQSAALLLMPNMFYTAVLHRFGVLHFLANGNAACRIASVGDDNVVRMAKEAVAFLINLVTELPPPCLVGEDCTTGLTEVEKASLRRTLIQFLVVKNRQRSEINTYVPPWPVAVAVAAAVVVAAPFIAAGGL